jgi:hypothetical protein
LVQHFSFDFEKYMCTNAKRWTMQCRFASDAIRYSALAEEKLVRPALAITLFEVGGGSVAVVTPVARAVEMIHIMSLTTTKTPFSVAAAPTTSSLASIPRCSPATCSSRGSR